MDTNINSTLADITVRGEGTKVNKSLLPQVCYFRVQSRGGVGTVAKFADRKVGAWAVLVSCNDHKGLRLATDVGYEFGMKVKGEFKTREEAIEAGKKIQETWGKVKAPAEPRSKGPTKADLAAKVAELEAKLAAALAA